MWYVPPRYKTKVDKIILLLILLKWGTFVVVGGGFILAGFRWLLVFILFYHII